LTVHDISFIEVKGGVDERKKNIKSFKSGNIQVIFLNSRFNGAGINLQESSDIIVYHRMDNSTLNQIIGRANRIGRIESLNVHHLQI
jgi:SNF2 family DNA or RNA helicase